MSGYDQACETLAEHFLQDEPSLAYRKGELAAAIQRAVEDWFDDEQALARARAEARAALTKAGVK